MKLFFLSFADSAKEFRNLRSMITAALLIALHTVMALFMSITVTESLRISISFIVNVVIGCLFGPVMGFLCGGVGDILQYLIKPTGPYFFGWTLNAALAGLIYGMFFYRKTPKTFPIFIKNQKDENTDKESLIGKITLYLIPAIILIVCCTVPFLSVVDKSTSEIITNGTAFSTIIHGITNNNCVNAAIVSAIIMIMTIILIVLQAFKLHALQLIIAVFGGFAAVLSVYTDKKTTFGLPGFWISAILLVCYMLILIVMLANKHKVDLLFMIRCIAGLTIDTVLVNIILGTVWVNMMYGKGFWFYLTSRLIKNLIQLPINIVITYYVLGFIRNIKKHI